MTKSAKPVSRPTVSAADQAARFRLLADNVPVLIAVFDAHDLTCLFANRQYAAAFGLDEGSIVGLTVSEVIGEVAAREIQPQVLRVLQERVSVSYERRLQQPGGEVRWVEVNLIPHVGPDGIDVQSAFVLISDITRFHEAEQAVRESEERMAKFMEASLEGIVFHRDGVITDANPALCELLGYSLETLIGRQALDLVAPDQVDVVRAIMEAGGETRYETAVVNSDGERLAVEFIVRTLWRHGERLRMAVVRDIRAQHAAMIRIHHLAHHDPLTGLLNRTTFMERLRERLTPGGDRAALLFIDLDNFKRVNDSLGHLEGDQVLRTVAERLRGGLRASDLVARFGGDEFVVLLEDVHQRKDVQVVLNALLSVVEVPVRADGRDLSVTPSIGVALYPDHGDTPEELLQHADTAMYLAKTAGRATYRFFEPAMAENAYADLVLEGELAQALTADEFVLFYQPQVDAQTGQLVGAEALLRWRHPVRGLLAPDAFILVAERHRLMVPLGEWVMQEAARQSRVWHESGVAPVPIAVNLSSMQFRLASFSKSVSQVLKSAGVPGEWLELELTERMLTEEIDRLPELLRTLRAQGLAISIDDFGTGYTALNQLTRLPLDKLKIDQSFVAGLPEDGGSAAITRAMVQMAKGLGLRVGAEGVRNARQWHLLAEWGCDELQGEVIATAMPADEFEAWLARRGRPARPGMES
ncbi:PAS domain S-box-containing protein/diguanylate cyclase (GGDEF) domain-containing protein [Roseateles sp. YR242]|uniref:putative bifunctional diguanylate cyclase/phosphodiesterase n=1 Tax=Roseateles sp. YR242 TaxID=1855305 RepID=UPI0008B8D650|nr:GGDEF and EAL domain-containing protein [Roseateles sp. YR242]SEL49660.1 PAS domain S-box-containing protein/diguanylate cyclase (GGDEF) domain-containing protein [Roseateles sp. YR242]